MRLRFGLQHLVLVFMASASVLLSSNSAIAAEQVVLKYRIFRQSLSVEELASFAESGKASRSLERNLALAQQDPKAIRQYLSQPVEVNPIFLDRVLNSPVGNILLDQISEVIHTPSRQADRQALRAALAVSASRDRQITLIEAIQNYPTSVVEVEGDRLENAYHQLRRLQELLPVVGCVNNAPYL